MTMTTRRTFLRLMAMAAGGLAAPALLSPGRALAASQLPWRNWSGFQRCQPSDRVAPTSIEELSSYLRGSKGSIRPVGAGHSFTPLVPTDGTLLTLDRLSGVVAHAPKSLEASIGAGTRLSAIGEDLARAGQALEIMPDVDSQTLAGATATGTHGSGGNIGALHASISGLKLVTVNGDVLNCNNDQNSELFDAARVSLGSLGVVAEITMKNLAPYKLYERTEPFELKDVLARFSGFVDDNRSFEFFYIPFSDTALVKTLNVTEKADTPYRASTDDAGLHDLKMLADWLGGMASMRRWITRLAAENEGVAERVGPAWKIYASPRGVRFNEMEYHLPRAAAASCLAEVIETMESRHPEVFFPIEVRTVKGDDAWLSPFYQRDSCSIAVHRFHEVDFYPFFASIEPIFAKYGGRPHWGKLHKLKAASFATHYPRWQEFVKLRAELDPEGRLLNDHLREVFDHV